MNVRIKAHCISNEINEMVLRLGCSGRGVNESKRTHVCFFVVVVVLMRIEGVKWMADKKVKLINFDGICGNWFSVYLIFRVCDFIGFSFVFFFFWNSLNG